MNKYRNTITTVDGIKFDSKREAERYMELKILCKAGVIGELELQPKFLLQEPFRNKGKCIRAITYKADFKYRDSATGKAVIEDVKGVQTEAFKIKQKLFLKLYGDQYDFQIVK